jgi:GntR family transcriptional regulator
MLNKQSSIPLYEQLKRLLEQQVSEGVLTPHSRIPSERELSEQFGISRMTARRALSELTHAGRIYAAIGKGTFVAEPKISQSLHELTSFTEEMRARGMVPSTRLLRAELVTATPPVAAALDLAAAGRLVQIERLRLCDGEPVAIEIAHFAFPDVERLLHLDLSGSIYALLRERLGIVPSEAIQEIEARLASASERQRLRLNEGAPVLQIYRTTLGRDRRPFEYVQSVYRCDRYRFVTRLMRGSL